jgi:hypothetical protein
LLKCFTTLKTAKAVEIEEIRIHIDVVFRFIDDLFVLLSVLTRTVKNIEKAKQIKELTQKIRIILQRLYL